MVQIAQHLNSVTRGTIANLLLEILEGEISHETRMAIADMGALSRSLSHTITL